MPAVTVDNILALPRVPMFAAEHARVRGVRSVTTAPSGFEGEGFPVRRGFVGVSLADLAARPTHVLVRTPHGARLVADPWIADTCSAPIKAVP